MTPEQFTDSLRGCVREHFPAYLDAVKQSIADDGRLNERKLQRFLNSPGGALEDAGLLRQRDVDGVNDLVVAAYKSRALHDYMMKATDRFRVDEGLQEQFSRLGRDPRAMPEREVRQLLDRLLRDDTFVTAPIRILMTDPGIRKALGVPANLTFNRYIQDVRKTIRDADSLDQVLRTSRVGPGGDVMVCNLAVACAVAIAAIVTIAAIIHTGVVAVNYVFAYAVLRTAVVFTVSGPDVTAVGPCATIPVGMGAIRSNCVNESGRTLWIIVRGATGFHRVPLLAGRSSIGMGLSGVEALLIGGRLNPVTRVVTSLDGRCGNGAYIVAQDGANPGTITVTEGSDCDLVIERNEAQAAAEAARRAGWSDLAGNGSAGANYDRAFAMSETAAAVPAGADFARMIDRALDDGHFYASLRIAALAQQLGAAIENGQWGADDAD
jgi:hypothetical protein